MRIINQNNFVSEISEMENTILFAYSNWSVYAMQNFAALVQHLNTINYTGEILKMEIEFFDIEFQIAFFGQLCEGWGEIFVISNGRIMKSYFGKNCIEKFINEFNQN